MAVAVRFIDCVNRSDLDGLVAIMADDHRLEVFDEAPVVGTDADASAWHGCFGSFPNYVIYPHRMVEVTDTMVAILGHTTGSHLALPDNDESRHTLIWLAEIDVGRVRMWKLVEDTPQNQSRLALT